MSSVSVREYGPSDRSAFLSLHRDIFSSTVDDAWFEWKYGQQSLSERPRILVAHANDSLVGALGYIRYDGHVDGRSVSLLQPSDAMVDPAYRDGGTFIDLLQSGADRFGTVADLQVGYPQSDTTRIYTRLLDWDLVCDSSRVWRVHDPGTLLDYAGRESLAGAASRLAPLFRLGFRGIDTLSGLLDDSTAHTVSVVADPAGSTLASVYDDHRPAANHITRNEAYYDWRLAKPGHQYTAYYAREGDDTVGCIVTGKQVGGRRVSICDYLPTRSAEQPAVLRHLLRRVVADHMDAAVIEVPPSLSSTLVRRQGFVDFGVVDTLREALPDPIGDRLPEPPRSPFIVRDESAGFSGLAECDNWHLAQIENEAF